MFFVKKIDLTTKNLSDKTDYVFHTPTSDDISGICERWLGHDHHQHPAQGHGRRHDEVPHRSWAIKEKKIYYFYYYKIK